MGVPLYGVRSSSDEISPRNFFPGLFRPHLFFSPPQSHRLTLMLGLDCIDLHLHEVPFRLICMKQNTSTCHILQEEIKIKIKKNTSSLLVYSGNSLYKYTLSSGQWASAGHTAYTSTHPANMVHDRILSPSSAQREIPDM